MSYIKFDDGFSYFSINYHKTTNLIYRGSPKMEILISQMLDVTVE